MAWTLPNPNNQEAAAVLCSNFAVTSLDRTEIIILLHLEDRVSHSYHFLLGVQVCKYIIYIYIYILYYMEEGGREGEEEEGD